MFTMNYLKFRLEIEFQIAIRWNALKRFLCLAYRVAESVIS